jgi:ferredoxin
VPASDESTRPSLVQFSLGTSQSAVTSALPQPSDDSGLGYTWDYGHGQYRSSNVLGSLRSHRGRFALSVSCLCHRRALHWHESTACIDVCPGDCIDPRKDENAFEAAEQLFIHPDECIDCRACVPVCPVKAIYPMGEVPKRWKKFIQKNRDYYKNRK